MGEQERQIVSNMYPGQGWKQKVKKMSDAQVLAIYYKELSRPKKEELEDPPEQENLPF